MIPTLAWPSRSDTILERTPGEEHECGVGMPEVVEPDVKKSLLRAEAVPAGKQCVGIHEASVASSDHEVVSRPRWMDAFRAS